MDADKVKAIRAKAEALGGQSLGQQGDMLVEMAAQRALAFCQREEIPEAMEQAVAVLVLEMTGLEGGNIKNIQRGDTTVAYDISKTTVKAAESLLRPFCRLGRVRMVDA